MQAKDVPVHLKVDTGMRRFGAMPEHATELAQVIDGLPELTLAGMMTHLASADAPDATATTAQVAAFDSAVAAVREAGIEVPVQHVANSAATLRFPHFHRDMVRIGIAMYGLLPNTSMSLLPGMRPAMTVFSRIGRLVPLEPGDAVSYGGTYRVEANERGALVPIGYGDGYRRGLSSRGWMAIGGERAEILGRVCMDQVVVRAPADGSSNVSGGDLVTVVGDGTAGTAGAPTLDELAELLDTISYEMATGITSRVPRLYTRDGNVVAIDDLHGYRELAPAPNS